MVFDDFQGLATLFRDLVSETPVYRQERVVSNWRWTADVNYFSSIFYKGVRTNMIKTLQWLRRC